MMKRVLSLVSPALILATSAVAQRSSDETCAACGGCGLLGAIPLVIGITIMVLSIALLVWVARDAKSRGMDSAVVWMLLVFFTNVLGLVVYILARPQGNLTQCASCGNNRLQAAVKCPHCGNA